MHAFSNGEKDFKNFQSRDEQGVTVILRQDGADWELAFEGRVEITETIGNPDAIGGGVEIDDAEELLPDMEDETQTEGLDNLEQDMEPKEEAQEKQDEVQDELEPEPPKEKQQEEELEQEDEKSKDKQKQKEKAKEKQEEEEEKPEYSGENEK